MRRFAMGLSIVTAVAASAGEAAPKTAAPARAVELIVMREAPAEPPVPSGATAQADLAPLPAEAFRVHDLSRRWVDHQLAQRFAASKTGAMQTEPGDRELSPSALPFVLAPAAAMPVPLWMRGGAIPGVAAARYAPGCAPVTYRPAGFLRADVEARRAGYFGIMSSIACEYGVPVGLFDALIIRESQYRAYVYSPKSAFGLTQLMPGTAAGLGVNRYDIEGNLRGGAQYLRQQLDRFGQYHLALAAYNAGPGRVRGGLVPQIAETRAYVDNVLFDWARLAGLTRRASVTTAAATDRSFRARAKGRSASVSTF